MLAHDVLCVDDAEETASGAVPKHSWCLVSNEATSIARVGLGACFCIAHCKAKVVQKEPRPFGWGFCVLRALQTIMRPASSTLDFAVSAKYTAVGEQMCGE